MADLDLDVIQARAAAWNGLHPADALAIRARSAGDVPALIAEVRRLRAENEHLRHGGSVPPPITTGATT